MPLDGFRHGPSQHPAKSGQSDGESFCRIDLTQTHLQVRLDHQESPIVQSIERLKQLGELALSFARRPHPGHELKLGSARRIGPYAATRYPHRILAMELTYVPLKPHP